MELEYTYEYSYITNEHRLVHVYSKDYTKNLEETRKALKLDMENAPHLIYEWSIYDSESELVETGYSPEEL